MWLRKVKVKVKSLSLTFDRKCLTLCDPVDCGLPGSSVHRILQARTLEWVAISFSRGSSRPMDRTRVSRIAGRCFNLWATREAPTVAQDIELKPCSPTSHPIAVTLIMFSKSHLVFEYLKRKGTYYLLT